MEEDSCRFAEAQLEVPVRKPQFLRCSSAVALRAMADKSVVDVHPRPHHALDLMPADSADFGKYFWQAV